MKEFSDIALLNVKSCVAFIQLQVCMYVIYILTVVLVIYIMSNSDIHLKHQSHFGYFIYHLFIHSLNELNMHLLSICLSYPYIKVTGCESLCKSVCLCVPKDLPNH